MTFNAIAQKIQAGFESSSGTTPEFAKFAKDFRRVIKKGLADNGATLTAFSRGHFYVSGFYRTANDDCGYFSISDVRGGGFGNAAIMYRTASNEKDYTGGQNRWASIDDSLPAALVSL